MLTRSVVVLAILTAHAAAQVPKTPEQLYAEGEQAYTLRDFEAAIRAFKLAFTAESDPAKKPYGVRRLELALDAGFRL